MKAPDQRCCGSGVCIINDAGECWCGQVWDGEKMAAPKLNPLQEKLEPGSIKDPQEKIPRA